MPDIYCIKKAETQHGTKIYTEYFCIHVIFISYFFFHVFKRQKRAKRNGERERINVNM